MLIEYKIILEDYEEFKTIYCKILNEKIQTIDGTYLLNLNEKLKQIRYINSSKYLLLSAEVKEEFKNNIESFNKYEYWEDAPFRTLKKVAKPNVKNDEDELLQLIYSSANNPEQL